MDQGNIETFVLSPVFEGMINELIKTTDRWKIIISFVY